MLMVHSVTLASTDNELPEDGATTPKHVRAILMYAYYCVFKSYWLHWGLKFDRFLRRTMNLLYLT
jgi:hypothetical protein